MQKSQVIRLHQETQDELANILSQLPAVKLVIKSYLNGMGTSLQELGEKGMRIDLIPKDIQIVISPSQPQAAAAHEVTTQEEMPAPPPASTDATAFDEKSEQIE